LELPAKYNYTIYKFHIPHPLSEKQFLSRKSIEKTEYLEKIKRRIRKEKKVFFRHHGLSLTTFWISILLVIISIILLLISLVLNFDSIIETNQLKTIIYIFLGIPIIALIYLRFRRFPTSFFSFRKYIKEKYDYYYKLKDTIDSCKDYHTYKKRYS